MMNEGTVELTAQDLRTYRETGYWISPKLIDDDRIERLRLAHERIWKGEIDGDGYPLHGPVRLPEDQRRLRKLDNGWWINNEIRAIVTDPLVGRIAAALMETDEVRLWHDQVLYKPGTGPDASDIANVGWHQDYGYWQCSSTTNMITMWLALQDTDLSNGGMMTVVGSHQWGLIPDSNTFFDTNLDALRDKYARAGHEWIEEPCILKAGHASFHHALTFHGSGPNLSENPRLSVVAHLMPTGTAYRARVMHHDNVRLLGPRPKNGQRFDNEYFPRLYPASSSL